VANLLMVLNPRRIPECVAAIDALPIDKVWLERYTEIELVSVIPEVLAECDHDMVGVLSDDTVPTVRALDAVLNITAPGRVATGWCGLDSTSPLVNLSTTPLTTDVPTPDAYTFPTRTLVESSESHEVRTYFAGHCLTFMPRELWHQFPWGCHGGPPGYASDLNLSWRLQQAGVPIFAARDGGIEHVKAQWNYVDGTSGRKLLIGVEPAGVRWDLQEAGCG
jgi:hypothetical protein